MGAPKRALIYSPPLLSASHRKTHLLVTAGAGHGRETRWQGISRKVQKKMSMNVIVCLQKRVRADLSPCYQFHH